LPSREKSCCSRIGPGSIRRYIARRPRWLETPEFGWPDELALLVASEKKADRLAEHYAARTRAGFTVTALLGAFGVSAAITQKLWPGSDVLGWVEIAGAVAFRSPPSCCT